MPGGSYLARIPPGWALGGGCGSSLHWPGMFRGTCGTEHPHVLGEQGRPSFLTLWPSALLPAFPLWLFLPIPSSQPSLPARFLDAASAAGGVARIGGREEQGTCCRWLVPALVVQAESGSEGLSLPLPQLVDLSEGLPLPVSTSPAMPLSCSPLSGPAKSCRG